MSIRKSTIISQCGNITRVSLLLAFIGKLIKEETSLKVITSGSIRGIQATIESPSSSANCKLWPRIPFYPVSVKWTVGIGHTIKVRGSFRGPISPIDRLCLLVKYGIDKPAAFFIKEADLQRVDDQKWSFETPVRLLSSKIWSPAGKAPFYVQNQPFCLVKFEIELCWVFSQNCFLGEIDGNPASNLLKLDHRSFEGSSRHPSSVVNLC